MSNIFKVIAALFKLAFTGSENVEKLSGTAPVANTSVRMTLLLSVMINIALCWYGWYHTQVIRPEEVTQLKKLRTENATLVTKAEVLASEHVPFKSIIAELRKENRVLNEKVHVQDTTISKHVATISVCSVDSRWLSKTIANLKDDLITCNVERARLFADKVTELKPLNM